jgi:hypothetical protein
MAEQLKGRIASVEKVVTAQGALEAAEALRDFEPDLFRGPGRKLGL